MPLGSIWLMLMIQAGPVWRLLKRTHRFSPLVPLPALTYCSYLEVDPSIYLTIIDAEPTLGGVWSQDRIYPGLISDSPVGLFEYSDLPLSSVTRLEDWSDLPAQKVHDYLYKYAEQFGLLERFKLDTKVSNIIRGKASTGMGR